MIRSLIIVTRDAIQLQRIDVVPSVGDNWASVLKYQNIRSCELRFIREIIHSLRQWFAELKAVTSITYEFAEMVLTNRKVIGMEVVAVSCIYSFKWIYFLPLIRYFIICGLVCAFVFMCCCCCFEVVFLFVAVFSKPCLFALSFCAKFPLNHCRADNSDESMKNSQTNFVGLDSMYILVLYGHFGEGRNHKHKSNGNQNKTSVMIWL